MAPTKRKTNAGDVRHDLATPSEFRPAREVARPSGRDTRFVDSEGDVVVPRTPPEIRGIDLKGGATNDATLMAAKTIVDNGATRHYIRESIRGSDRGSLVDPRGPSFNLADFLDGEKRYAFREVSAGVFRSHSKYLATGQTSLLRDAERLLRDG